MFCTYSGFITCFQTPFCVRVYRYVVIIKGESLTAVSRVVMATGVVVDALWITLTKLSTPECLTAATLAGLS